MTTMGFEPTSLKIFNIIFHFSMEHRRRQRTASGVVTRGLLVSGFLGADRVSSLCNFFGALYLLGTGLPPSTLLGAPASRQDQDKIVRRHRLHRLNANMIKQKKDSLE